MTHILAHGRSRGDAEGRWPHALALPLRAALLGGAALLASACVTTYQPLGRLQRPVAVDPQAANLEGLRILVRCLPGEELDASGASTLCRRVRTLLANQGAIVEVEVRHQATASRPAPGPPHIKGAPVDLVLEHRISATELPNQLGALYLSALTLTIVPLVVDRTFTHDVVVKDGRGALLAEERLEARFVETTSAPAWLLHWLLDLLVRPKAEALAGDAYQRDFSRDLYAQLSQLAFNARMRSEVLRTLEPTTSGGGPP